MSSETSPENNETEAPETCGDCGSAECAADSKIHNEFGQEILKMAADRGIRAELACQVFADAMVTTICAYAKKDLPKNLANSCGDAIVTGAISVVTDAFAVAEMTSDEVVEAAKNALMSALGLTAEDLADIDPEQNLALN